MPNDWKPTKNDILSWHLEDYVKRYMPWAENADAGDTIAGIYGGGYYCFTAEDASKLLAAYEKGDEIFKRQLDFKELNRILKYPNKVEIAGKKYEWPIARAIVSYFFEKMHLHYLDGWSPERIAKDEAESRESIQKILGHLTQSPKDLNP
jgi:hypothetical protein